MFVIALPGIQNRSADFILSVNDFGRIVGFRQQLRGLCNNTWLVLME